MGAGQTPVTSDDDPHRSRTPRADERIHLGALRDQPCPCALRGRRGDLGEFLDGVRRLSRALGHSPLPPARVTVPAIVPHEALAGIRDARGERRQLVPAHSPPFTGYPLPSAQQRVAPREGVRSVQGTRDQAAGAQDRRGPPGPPPPAFVFPLTAFPVRRILRPDPTDASREPWHPAIGPAGPPPAGSRPRDRAPSCRAPEKQIRITSPYHQFLSPGVRDAGREETTGGRTRRRLARFPVLTTVRDGNG